ncbi:MAG: hypothetical protein LC624_05580 [Halobacteriales archaeon]|nr:hypothetical protein [Halobacteriales archaeon]
MQPTDVEQVRAALRALLLEPRPADFDRACALIEALPPKRRSVPVGVEVGFACRPRAPDRRLGRN